MTTAIPIPMPAQSRCMQEDKTKLKPVACVLSRASLPDFSYSASAGCWICKVITYSSLPLPEPER